MAPVAAPAAVVLGGEVVRGGVTFAVVNPATEEVVGHAPECSWEDVDRAVRAAHAALPGWRADEGARGAAMAETARRLRGNAEELADLLTREQGKPLPEARGEVEFAAKRFEYFARLDRRPVVAEEPAEAYTLSLSPAGVVSILTPWNYPVSIAANRVAPALCCGNTVVCKPSPYAPLTLLRVFELVHDLYPPGVVSVVSGHDDVGRWMVEHELPRAVSFTGSTHTGRQVALAAAGTLKRTLLEMGGNDPALVLDDADVAATARAVARNAFASAGQVCYCIKRVYAPRGMCEELTAALAREAGSVAVGDGFSEGVQMGPLNNETQLRRVEHLVEEAVTQGARVRTGDRRLPERGYFYPPTVLADCHDGMRVVAEEQFGPVIPVVAYDALDAAVEACNASTYGLAGSVWGGDDERVRRVADRIEAGMVWLNGHGKVAPDQPHGGMRHSAIGVVGGSWLALLGVGELKVTIPCTELPT